MEKIKNFRTTESRTCGGGSTYVVPAGYQGHLHTAQRTILIEDGTARVAGTGAILTQRNILAKSQHVLGRVIRVVGKSSGNITNPRRGIIRIVWISGSSLAWNRESFPGAIAHGRE